MTTLRREIVKPSFDFAMTKQFANAMVACIAVLLCSGASFAQTKPSLSINYNNQGLSSVRFGEVELLKPASDRIAAVRSASRLSTRSVSAPARRLLKHHLICRHII